MCASIVPESNPIEMEIDEISISPKLDSVGPVSVFISLGITRNKRCPLTWNVSLWTGSEENQERIRFLSLLEGEEFILASIGLPAGKLIEEFYCNTQEDLCQKWLNSEIICALVRDFHIVATWNGSELQLSFRPRGHDDVCARMFCVPVDLGNTRACALTEYQDPKH